MSQPDIPSPGEQFWNLHQRERPFVLANVWDIGTARVLAGLGFEALATTSLGHAMTLGRRDGSVTREEALAHAATIVAATPLPVSADLENGFDADPEAVAETIRRAEAVGLAGASIEDASGDPHAPIYDASLALERITAAVEAARTLPRRFVLTARAENFLHGRPDLDDTIRRLQMFDQVGADVLYAPGLPDLDAVRAVCTAVDKPVNVLVTPRFAGHRFDELAAAGARRISLGPTLFRAAMAAMLRAAKEIQEQGRFDFVRAAAEAAVLDQFMTGGRPS